MKGGDPTPTNPARPDRGGPDRDDAVGVGGPDALRIRAVLAGDADALDRWYRSEHPLVWRLCTGFLADPAEADELAQDAMLKLLDSLARWDASRPYGTWRSVLVLNLCRDRLRRRDARRRAEREAAALALPASLPSPPQAAEQAELRASVAGALSALTAREREAFVLRELEDLSTGAVAEVLGVTESTVRSLLTLARRRLRHVLASRLADCPGEGAGGAP